MIKKFVERFMQNQEEVLAAFRSEHPSDYLDVVKVVVKAISDEHDGPDINRIHEIDDGEYQGTLVYVIAEQGYQPSRYWVTTVSYGSCSGCDTLQSIADYSDDVPTEYQAEQYYQLALNLVQDMKAVGWGSAEENNDE